MERLTQKCILLLLSFTLVSYFGLHTFSSVFLLLALLLSCLSEFISSKPQHGLILCYLIICLIDQEALCYLPLLVFDAFDTKHFSYFHVLFPIVIFFQFQQQQMFHILVLTLSFVAMLIRYQYGDSVYLKELYKQQRDSTKEVSNLLEEKNRDLLLQQDYRLELATLDERNRIAREIHDNVGHLLSSSLLQMGALETMNQHEELVPAIENIKSTLSTAMSSIRESVHNLHDHSLDLEQEIHRLLLSFTFCQTTLSYDIIHGLPQKLTYQFLAILKEGLNNIMKHSNATMVTITLREHPSFYQFVIHDNGTKITMKENGIGLRNISQRIQQFHGYVNYTNEHGFKIFITIQKEDSLCES